MVKEENILSGITEKDLRLMLKYGKASNKISGFVSADFITLPYGIVRKDLPNLLEQDLIIESLELVINCQTKDFDFDNLEGNEVIAFLLWIITQLDFIAAIEKKNLHSDAEMEMKAAGIDRLNEFGVLNTIHDLAGKDILKHKEIEEIPYFEVYQVLKMQKISSEIEKNYNKIMQAK